MSEGKSLRKLIFQLLLMTGIVIGILQTEKTMIYAQAWDNAYDYYDTYGNLVVFQPNSQTDGNIYFGTRGATAVSGIRYRTIGWKASIYDGAGTLLQELYFESGGAYLHSVGTQTVGTYKYNLYAVSLSSVKSRLRLEVLNALEHGNCSIWFDACMVVSNNGKLLGGMNDNGIAWGCVYTSYEGIVHAANWTSISRDTLYSYFHKPVEGLYRLVTLAAANGVTGVSGAGLYCYGTYVTIEAQLQSGYEFACWYGTEQQSVNPYRFYLTGDCSLTAYASPKRLLVTYYRNLDSSDTGMTQQMLTYGAENQFLHNPGWMKSGYHALGWSHHRTQTWAEYTLTQEVTSRWIETYRPAVSLYEIWAENQYVLVFDGNGAKSGSVESIHAKYTGSATMPQNCFVSQKENTAFRGWSLLATAQSAEFAPGEQVSIQSLVTRLGLANTNGATITLYAIWDEIPAIQADDLYVSLLDAQQGRITEAYLASYAVATDKEDGVISYGRHMTNSFVLIDFSLEKFTQCQENDTITVTYRAIDSSKNQVDRNIKVHIIDTTLTIGKEVIGKSRLIDQKYFEDANGNLIDENKGGLGAQSKWRTEKSWRQLLRNVLSS